MEADWNGVEMQARMDGLRRMGTVGTMVYMSKYQVDATEQWSVVCEVV